MTVLIFDPRAFQTPKQAYKAATHAFRHFDFCAEQHERYLSGVGRYNRHAAEFHKLTKPSKPEGFSYAAKVDSLAQAKLRRDEYALAKREYFDALHAIQFADVDSKVHSEACFRLNNLANRYRYQRRAIRAKAAA